MINGSTILALIIIIGVAVLLRRRRRAMRKQHDLARNQRAVSIFQQWLDPVFEVLIVGGVIWTDLQHGLLPWLALAVGLAIGLPIGAIRGRFMYVRSIGKGGKIVVERNAAEISVLFVLIIIKLAAHKISAKPTSPINLIVVALLGVGLASSIGRVVYITVRHYQSSRSTTSPSADLD